MTPAVLFLLLRLALAAVLYAFLTVTLAALWRGLRAQREVAAETPRASLVPAEPGSEQPSFELGGLNTIGRARDNSLVLGHASVSSYHARLSFTSGHWLVEDLGSRNGTRINGLELADPLAITYGDLVSFGAVVFRLQPGHSADLSEGPGPATDA